MRRLRLVSTLTPQRISFAGGGTDQKGVYSKVGGSVVSAAINKYVYVTVKRHNSSLFGEKYRLNYSQTEQVRCIEEIKNGVARECLKLLEFDEPLAISTMSDVPASSGLGSSSAFAVGLLQALHRLKGESISAGQLAEEACYVEIDMLGSPIGKQDQYAAAYGGLNHFGFSNDGRVSIDHLVLEPRNADELFNNLVLIWSGVQRDASLVLKRQKNSIAENCDKYSQLILDAERCKKLFLSDSVSLSMKVGELLADTWRVKRSLDESTSNQEIDKISEALEMIGAAGGKLCGAGGGGFFVAVVPESKREDLSKLLGANRLVRVRYEPIGSRIIAEVM